MDAIFENLTPPQRTAVEHIDGPLLILAGPGSGKTRVVTYRIAHMIQQGIRPRQVLALTFTNKAADEMRARVERLAPGQAVWMGTFHRFCAQQLRLYAPMIGLSENYSIYDTSDSKQAMKRAIEAADVSISHTSPEQIAASISDAKNRLITPEMMENQSMFRARETVAARVYPIYQQLLLTANAVDFDDLLLHFAKLLRENSEVRQELDARYKYIMVDEYQDTNLAQYAIVRALSIDHPNLAVTGDPDQSIYGWRGADLNNILDFEKDYPHVNTVRLEQNYRSTPNILRVADQLIRHNRKRKAKDLFTDNPEGEPVVLRIYEDGYEEADDLADQIVSAVHMKGQRPGDFAVFCRMNALTRSLEHAFRRRGLPYQVVNGLEFYQRKEIKDLLAYLHLVNNPSNDVAFQRIVNTPTRGIGAKTILRLREFADRNGIPLLEAARRADEVDTIAKRATTLIANFVRLYDRLRSKATATLEDLLRFLIDEIQFADYLTRTSTEQQENNPVANVDELINAAVEFDLLHPEDGSLELYLEQVSLVADTDAFEDSDDRVKLMTMHAAKGLEFPHVFVIAVEDELLPHRRSRESEDQIEEERRLLFVAVTRAMKSLQLSFCKRRSVRGELRPVIASQFLTELPREELQTIESESKSDWFEQDEFDAVDYPDSWDLPEVGDESSDSKNLADDKNGQDFDSPTRMIRYDETSQIPDDERDDSVRETNSRRPTKMLNAKSGLQTGADLLSSGVVPAGAFREGVLVQHPDYGQGTIVAVSGRGPKRSVKVEFDGQEASFLIAYANLSLVDP